MSIGGFLRDKLLTILGNVVGLLLLCLYLRAVGNTYSTLLLVCIFWVAVFVTCMLVAYWRRHRYFAKMMDTLNHLEKPYLIHEMMPTPQTYEDEIYKQVLGRANKAVIERIRELETEQKEYRDFIEGWIHEVKLPITGIRLACHNMQPAGRRQIEEQLTRLDNDVEQALFYARSDTVHQDFMIQKIELRTVVKDLLKKNKYILIQNGMSANVQCGEEQVYCDPLWLQFILGQLLANAVKYRKGGSGTITFTATEEKEGGTTLTVRDDGVGIALEEQRRVFQKGFTGSNGRQGAKATGIGLYLCQKLCRKLGLQISLVSEQGVYTAVSIYFPKHSFLSEL